MDNKERDFIEKHASYYTDVSTVTKAHDNIIISTSKLDQFQGLAKDHKATYRYNMNNDTEYRVTIVDERLLYSSLFAWRDLELTRLFQGDNETIIDDTYGKFRLAKEVNYINTLRAAKELLKDKHYYNVSELYDLINKIIDYPSFKPFVKRNGDGLSEEFFDDVYLPLIDKANTKQDSLGYYDLRDYPKDIIDTIGKDKTKNVEKVLKKYYKKK